jgi:hypothetical protein
VRKSSFPWAIAIILLIGYAGWHLTGLAIAAVGLFAAYLLSLRVHPRMRHGRCNGTGEHRGSIFTWVHRKCPGCQGGRIIRWGAGRWGAGHIRGEHRDATESRAAARDDGTWR